MNDYSLFEPEAKQYAQKLVEALERAIVSNATDASICQGRSVSVYDVARAAYEVFGDLIDHCQPPKGDS